MTSPRKSRPGVRPAPHGLAAWGRFARFILLCVTILTTGAAADSTNLLRNGDFEAGTVTPAGWQTIDGLSSFWEKDDDAARGKVLRFNTDILQSQAYPWWAKTKHGAAPKDAPARLPTREPKYDTLAGLDGVWFWSDPVPVRKGKAYWLTVDAKGPGQMFAWLVGYTNAPDTSYGADIAAFQGYLKDPTGTVQPGRGHKGFLHSYVWKGQLNIIGTGAWKTYRRREKPFRPTAVTPEVCYVRLLLWAIWPPGDYRFDNIRLYEIPDTAESGSTNAPPVR